LSELKEFDDTPELKEQDNYETPKAVFDELCKKYNVKPTLDVCADELNTKCYEWFGIDKCDDALKYNWNFNRDIWCNPPHTKTELFVRKSYREWKEHGNFNIMMIIPTNTMSSHFWHEYIEGNAEYHAIRGRIRFLQDGKLAPHCSRNAYVCVIWRAIADP